MWRREFRPFRISLSTDRRGQRLQLSSGHSIGNFYWALRDSGGWLSHLALIPTPIPFTNWKIKIFTVGHPSLDGNEAKWGDSLRLQFLKLYLGGGGEGQTRNRILNCPSCSMVWGSGHPWQLQVHVWGLSTIHSWSWTSTTWSRLFFLVMWIWLSRSYGIQFQLTGHGAMQLLLHTY